MKKRIIAAYVFLLATISGNAAVADECMRCTGRLACVGDTKAEVLLKCGDPYFKDVEGYDIAGESDMVVINGRSYFSNVAVKKNRIERWAYYLGQNQFVRILTFEGIRLKSIELGGKP